jgi:hypothetical protein
MSDPTILKWMLGGTFFVITVLIGIIYRSIITDLHALSAFVMGPDNKVVAYGKCVSTMSDVRQEIHVERQERKGDVQNLQQQINDHIQAA